VRRSGPGPHAHRQFVGGGLRTSPYLTRRGALIARSNKRAKPYLDWNETDPLCSRNILTAWADWIQDIAQWHFFITGTFERPTEDSWTYVGRLEGRKHVHTFAQRLAPQHLFVAEETHRDGAVHYHLLIPYVPTLDIKMAWERYKGGFTAIKQVTPGRIRYAAKYVAKESGWFMLW